MYMWTKKLAVLGFNTLKSPGSVIYCFFVEFNHQKGGLLRQEVTSEKDNRKHSINGTRERFSENCITAVVHVLLAIAEISVPSYTVVSTVQTEVKLTVKVSLQVCRREPGNRL